MTRDLEYLDEALEEAEAAARWYADRSVNAAAGFSEEIDAAEEAIADFLRLGHRLNTVPVDICFVAIPSASFTGFNLSAS